MTRRPGRPAGLALAATLAACAACASVDAPPPGPPPFRGARRLVLVRDVDDPRAQRARDPLDALKESLDARGYEARVVEVRPGKDRELRDLERLEERIVGHFWTRERTTGRAERLGADAGAVVTRLGADAVAAYHRLDARLAPPPPAPGPPWGSPFPGQQPAAPVRRPSGALSLVAADGSAAWFPWGGEGAERDPAALINAAEAIEALLAALAGDVGDDG
jgi:hypothetical protein